jgi:hypothetical protein
VTLAVAGSASARSQTLPAPSPKTISAQAGPIGATLSYLSTPQRYGGPTATGLQLAIERGGTTVFAAPVAAALCHTACQLEELGHGPAQDVSIVDLEGDGEPEILVDLYSGGAHCCSIVEVFAYVPSTGSYTAVEHDFGDPGAKLTDIDGDGKLEFESADDRFAYAFAPFAFSGMPPLVLDFAAGQFHDVTTHFPALIRTDAARELKAYRTNRRQGFGLGFIAAWAADESLLGRHASAHGTLVKLARADRLHTDDGVDPSGMRFVVRLERFLHENGYG